MGLRAELEYHKTAPFITGITTVVNLVASLVVAFSINLLTQEKPPKYSLVLLIAGGGIQVLSSILIVFFPYARGWFNK